MKVKQVLTLDTWNGTKEIPIPHIVDASGCFVCQKNISKRGYSYFADKADGRRIGAHRYIYELIYGRLLGPEMQVRHRCDNKACINPDHLQWGTNEDNQQDKMDRGRHSNATGEKHPLSKLTDALVRQLRKRRKSGESYRGLARELGLNKTTITDAINGITWKHVK